MQSLAGIRLSSTTASPRTAQHAFQGNQTASPITCLTMCCMILAV